MKKNLDFQIGEKVIWIKDNVKNDGYFLGNCHKGFCDVLLPSGVASIKKSILKLDI